MLPQSCPFVVTEDPRLQSHKASPSTSSFPLSSLSTALRISISGEEMGADSAPPGQAPLPEQHEEMEGELEIPDDMPVDLRAKLALAMINLGKVFPEVLQMQCTARH